MQIFKRKRGSAVVQRSRGEEQSNRGERKRINVRLYGFNGRDLIEANFITFGRN
ncbi:hypothetical protein LR48_Vigan04g226500 [Vigna angularis]|uniref:Uncharacterized protein n=1 Tax=Phaseolus angularis TaxID=3914 RepID=A0A0L9UHN4_PHAAN|nr:hypothetical protein LR48_Vigan04g226500 [Vigna angularis]